MPRAPAAICSTARSNWLRAINYYQSAAFPFDREDENRSAAIESMRRCARDYLQHRNPRGEVVPIPWPGGYPLEAYFLPAPASGRPAGARRSSASASPASARKSILYKVARHAGERGMSLLAVDLFGAGQDADSSRSSAAPIWR